MTPIGPQAFRAMPWKNGKGVTTEIYREDDAAGTMLWRVSIAGVSENGAFSSFAGYERHILALSGGGMELEGGPHGIIRVAPPFVPRTFSGDWTVSARLLGGPLTDFNLIIRRDWGTGCLRVWDDNQAMPSAPPAGTRLLWLQTGALRIGATALAAGEACLLEPGEDFTLVPSPGTRIIACMVQPAR